MKWFIKLLVVILFSGHLTFAAELNSEPSKGTGTITGVVLDKKTQKPLAGVNVIVEGTRKGTTSGQNGEFTISKLAAGKYTLLFQHIGYITKRSEEIEVATDKIVDLNTIPLEEHAIPYKRNRCDSWQLRHHGQRTITPADPDK